ncbi:MAG: flagellar biosynthesis protein FliQ [Spirochaetales bacterium]|nr:flagellar biosynthesis protein FliQ [Spirochaetales bacterium]
MDFGMAVNLVRNGILEVLIISAPLLLIGMGVGLIISIFQATTSIQEQTLTFVPKIAAILGAIIFLGPWILNSLTQFTVRLIDSIPSLGK